MLALTYTYGPGNCTKSLKAGLDIGYVPAGSDAFFRSSGQFGPQQLNLCWPAGPVAFDRFFFFLNLAHNSVNARSQSK